MAGARAGQHPVWPAGDGVQHGIIEQHGEGDIGRGRGRRRRGGRPAAQGSEGGQPGRGDVAADDVMPGAQEVAGHRQPHAAQADEANPHPKAPRAPSLIWVSIAISSYTSHCSTTWPLMMW